MATEKRLIYVEDILLGVEAFKKCYRENASLYPIVEASLGALTLVTEFVNRTPTVDAVEVVRCKDCKHYMAEEKERCEAMRSTPYGLCIKHRPVPLAEYHEYRNQDDFCSYGERRTDERL